jgi:FkbM family methyltransferase
MKRPEVAMTARPATCSHGDVVRLLGAESLVITLLIVGGENYVGEVAPTGEITLSIAGRQFTFEGVSADDVYLTSLQHGPDNAFETFCSHFFESLSRDRVDGQRVLLDVGANIGVTAAILSAYCPQASVVAIEAGPGVVEVLQRNVRRNGLISVTPLHVAVGHREGVVQFFEESAFGHIVDDSDAPEVRKHGLTVDVEMRTIDSIVDDLERDSGVDAIDLVKVDIEGAEPAAIEGMQRTLEKFAPMLWVELNSWSLMSTGQHPISAVQRIINGCAEVFRVGGTSSDPRFLRPVEGSDSLAIARSLVHDNVVVSRSWEDIVIVPKGGQLPESLRQLADRPHDEINLLREELQSMQQSKIWRYSAPLRRLRHHL